MIKGTSERPWFTFVDMTGYPVEKMTRKNYLEQKKLSDWLTTYGRHNNTDLVQVTEQNREINYKGLKRLSDLQLVSSMIYYRCITELKNSIGH